jgi:hypothetical protein
VVSDETLDSLLPKLVNMFLEDEGVVTLLEDGVEIPFPELKPAFVTVIGDKTQVILQTDGPWLVGPGGCF